MSSFVADKIVMDGLTFDDVLLIPAYSEVLPKTVELKTKFSRNISLNVPFVTAAMDTVTESVAVIEISHCLACSFSCGIIPATTPYIQSLSNRL